jgi:hypothetical protein
MEISGLAARGRGLGGPSASAIACLTAPKASRSPTEQLVLRGEKRRRLADSSRRSRAAFTFDLRQLWLSSIDGGEQ